MLTEHPAYQEEKVRLEETTAEVEKSIAAYSELRDNYKRDVTEKMRSFQHNPDESSQAYVELLTGTSFISHYTEKLRGLERSRGNPYFARIDFTSDDKGVLEKCYIGKTGLLREGDNYPIIIDWRAPIATIYYEGRLGDAEYEVPNPKLDLENEVITGQLSLKRQFTIEKNRLQDIFDIDVTTNDPLLQKALGANADNRLKDIAATIQAEQNKIIRAELREPLIVQGVAGSGKTTIALHRIAYLIYNYEKYFTPDSFMIIAPNRLFLDYISAVLPELGVEQTKQTTYIDLMLQQLGGKYKVTNPNHKLTAFVNLKNDENYAEHFHLLKEVSRFKGSMTFKKAIDRYFNDLEENFTPHEDMKIDDQILVKASEVRRIFFNEYKYYPIYKRIAKLKSRLKKQVKETVADLIDKEKAKVEQLVEQYYLSGSDSEKDREKILKRIEQRDYNITHWGEEAKTIVESYLTPGKQLKLLDYYADLVINIENLDLYTGGNIPEDILQAIVTQTKETLEKGQIEFEDLAPLVYLQSRIFGLEDRLRLSHVVIDEAQDFSLFQFYIIRRLTHTDSFTILGDLSQGIHSYRAIRNWDELKKAIFPKVKTNYTTLIQSYRTTIEIMHLANEIIKNYKYEGRILANPIIRHGKLPQFLPGRSPEEIAEFIATETGELLESDIKSIAIICKTMDECEKLHRLFPKNEARPKLVTEDMSEYEGGVLILPSYLAKGLEFDAVFVANLEEEYQVEELDIKLLYIAMTRALHRLYICTSAETSPLLQNVGPEFMDTFAPVQQKAGNPQR